MQFLNCYDIASGVNSSGSNVGAQNHVEHHVSKIDTLAGIAIKYGVEVADIRRLNGLATDLQMFAHRTLLIPLPGRHPPSPGLSNGSSSPCENNNIETAPPLFEPEKLKVPQMKISPAMSKLQRYYGLSTEADKTGGAEGTEMAVYRTSPQSSNKVAAILEPRGSSHRASSAEDAAAITAEPLLKEDHSSTRDFLPVMTVTGLAMRSKTTARAAPARDADPVIADEPPAGVRRSTSTPNLHEQENGGGSLNVWPPSRWSLRPDLQVLSSTAAIAVPIFDGLPKPMSAWRGKAAMD